MSRTPQANVKRQPLDDDDSDIELLEDFSTIVTPRPTNERVRLIPTYELTYGYSQSGRQKSRIIVDEEDDQNLCRQYFKVHDSWYCIGCYRMGKSKAKTKATLNGLVFEVPVRHSCTPESKATAMKEQEEIRKKHNILTPIVQPSSGSRKRTRSTARELDQSDLDHSAASTPTGSKKNRGRPKKAKIADESEDDVQSSSGLRKRTRSTARELDQSDLDNSTASTPTGLKKSRDRPKKAKIADESANHTASEDDTASNETTHEVSHATNEDVAVIQEPPIPMLSVYEILSGNEYADVIITSSDGIKIPSYRIVLSKYSAGIDKAFKESTELPVKIIDDEFDGETIKAAVHFCYGKLDAIDGKESTIFKLAMKYDISVLKEACVRHFKNSVSAENVCNLIQIAYSNSFDDLKTKCLQVLVEKQKEIPTEIVDALPGKILADALRYKAL